MGQKSLPLSIAIRFLLDQSKSILLSLRSLLDSSLPIEIQIFRILKGLTNQFWLCLLLSSIPLNPFLEHKFFLAFLVKIFKAFLLLQLVWHFYPSFLIKSHSFMHNHPFLLKISNLHFLRSQMIFSVLIKFFQWVFVHASYKHDSFGSISNFSWFVKIFEIRVHVSLKNWGFCSIGWNWLKLTLLVDRLIAYNMFPNCCDDQLVNWCDFWKIRVYVLQILGILHKTWFFGLTFQNYGKLSISMHSFMHHLSRCFMYHVVFQDCIYTSCISL